VTVLAIVLSVVGGTLELAGLAFVVLDIRGDRQLAERYLEAFDDIPNFGGPTGPMKPDAILMREFQRTSGTEEQQLKRARADFEGDLTQVRTAAARSTYQQRDRLTGFIRELLQGGLGRRKIGAALIALGIVVSVAANVVSAAAQLGYA
jgi:hypothetical protein